MTVQMSVEIKGLDELTKRLGDMGRKQVPFATSVAINKTIDQIWENEQKAILNVFDRPRRQTVSSMFRRMSTKRKLSGRVAIKDDVGKGNAPEKWLRPQIEGGARVQKRFERALEKTGLLPRGWYVVPAKGVRLDKYGNLTGGMHVKILSALRAAETTAGFTMNRPKGKPGKYFVPAGKTETLSAEGIGVFGSRRGAHPTLPPGIYERKGRGGRGQKAIFIFVKKKPRYKKRLPFHKIARKTKERHFERHFHRAFELAMRTAR